MDRFLFLLIGLLIPLVSVGQNPPVMLGSPSKGAFLVATPQMSDPRFQEAVILLLEHDDKGSLGLIINRRTRLRLSEILSHEDDPSGSAAAKQSVFFGGPVAMGSLLLLLRNQAYTDRSQTVFADIHWSASRELLAEHLAAGHGMDKLRVYIGYAGWGPQQLQSELDNDGWRLFEGEADAVFADNVDKLWQRFMADGVMIMAAHRLTQAQH